MKHHPLSLFHFCPKCGSSQFIQNDERSKKCSDCGFVYYFNVSASVAAIIVTDQKEMILCRRAYDPYKGSLDLPGGFVDFDETVEDAVRREVREETGAEIDKPEYFCSFPNVYPYSGLDVHTLDFFFVCSVTPDSVFIPKDDVDAIYFIPFDQVNPEEIKLLSVRKAVERFLQARS